MRYLTNAARSKVIETPVRPAAGYRRDGGRGGRTFRRNAAKHRRPGETDAKLGWISIDSPLARAMLKKRLDDEFEAQLPGGPARFVIVDVAYPDQA